MIMNVLVQQKKLFHKLTDVCILTEQLAEAVDRKDEVSVQMVLSMREEPLLHLMEIEDGIRSGLLTLPENDAIYMSALLHGAAPQSPLETQLSEQIAMNTRLLERVTALDKRISLKLGGKESYYNKYR